MSKRAAAQAAVSKISVRFEKDIRGASPERPFVLGLGTGSTVAEFWPLFHEYLAQISARSVVIVPTSHQSKQLVIQSRSAYPVVELGQYPEVNCVVDGYDAADPQRMILIKGGGGAHVGEKLVAFHSAYNLYIGTKNKIFDGLNSSGVPIPVEVVPPAVPYVMKKLAGLPVCARLRSSREGKMGPVITDLGNFIIDVTLPPDSALWTDLPSLDSTLNSLTGVVGTGLFIDLAHDLTAV